MIEILLMILSVILLVIVIFVAKKFLNKYLYHSILETNETALEEDASNNVSSAFLMTRVTFLLILFVYAGIIYLTGVYNYNYTILLCLALLYWFIQYKIEIGGCKLMELLWKIRFDLSGLERFQWELVVLIGSIRVKDGKFWLIWEPLRKKLEIKR